MSLNNETYIALVRVKKVACQRVHFTPGSRSINSNTCKVSLSVLTVYPTSDAPTNAECYNLKQYATGQIWCPLPAVSPLILYRVVLSLCAKHGLDADTKTICTCAFKQLVEVAHVKEPTFKWLRRKLIYSDHTEDAELLREIRYNYNNANPKTKKRKRSTSTHDSDSQDGTESEEKEENITEWWGAHAWEQYAFRPLVQWMDGLEYTCAELFFLQAVCRGDRDALVEKHTLEPSTLDIRRRSSPATLPCIDPLNPPGWPFCLPSSREWKRWRWCAAAPSKLDWASTLINTGDLFVDEDTSIAIWQQWKPQYIILRQVWDASETTCVRGCCVEYIDAQAATCALVVYCQSFARAFYLKHVTSATLCVVVTLSAVHYLVPTDKEDVDTCTHATFDHVEDWTLLHGIRALEHMRRSDITHITAICDVHLEHPIAQHVNWDNDRSPRLFWTCVSRHRATTDTTGAEDHQAMITPILQIMYNISEHPQNRAWCINKSGIGIRFYRFPGAQSKLWQNIAQIITKDKSIHGLVVVCGTKKDCKCIPLMPRTMTKGTVVYNTRDDLHSTIAHADTIGIRQRNNARLTMYAPPTPELRLRERNARLVDFSIVTPDAIRTHQFAHNKVALMLVLDSFIYTGKPAWSRYNLCQVLRRISVVDHDRIIIVASQSVLRKILKQRTHYAK